MNIENLQNEWIKGQDDLCLRLRSLIREEKKFSTYIRTWGDDSTVKSVQGVTGVLWMEFADKMSKLQLENNKEIQKYFVRYQKKANKILSDVCNQIDDEIARRYKENKLNEHIDKSDSCS